MVEAYRIANFFNASTFDSERCTFITEIIFIIINKFNFQAKDYKSSIVETEQTKNQDLKIQILQKKLQEAEDNIITLSTNLENELSVKDEISEKLDININLIVIVVHFSCLMYFCFID